MKTRNFQKYLEKRLNKKELIDIEKQAEFEYKALKNLQKELASAVMNYMRDEEIGFNEMVRRLGISPTQVKKIQNGQANVTLATLALIATLLKKQPHILFK